MKIFLVAMMLLIPFPTKSQKGPEFKKVSSADVVAQIEAAILANELQKRSPEDTVRLVKEITLLNKMQIQNAEMPEYHKIPPNTKPSLEGLIDTKKAFYELRNHICQSFSGILVDLDGEVKPGCSNSVK